jgi:hypothetical protein
VRHRVEGSLHRPAFGEGRGVLRRTVRRPGGRLRHP